WPRAEAEHRLVRLPADDERIHGGEELRVTVVLAAAFGQPVEPTVEPGDEPVEARAHEHGRDHRRRRARAVAPRRAADASATRAATAASFWSLPHGAPTVLPRDAAFFASAAAVMPRAACATS